MRETGELPSGISGSLLVAAPTLLDPHFRRSVVLLAKHDADEGAFGVVVNRPAAKTVQELLPEKDLGLIADVPVYFGGPVGRDQLTFAALRWHASKRVFEFKPHLTLEEASGLAEEQMDVVRAFVGYAGWTQGQLEGELAQRAWLVEKPTRESLQPENLAGLWRQIVRGKGPLYRLLAEAPDNPSLN